MSATTEQPDELTGFVPVEPDPLDVAFAEAARIVLKAFETYNVEYDLVEYCDLIVGFDQALISATGRDFSEPEQVRPPTGQRRAVRPLHRAAATAVYRAFDATGHLLYVGITKSPAQRELAHRMYSDWWRDMHHLEYEWLPNRSAAEALECELVTTLRPPFNTAMNPEARRRRDERERS